MAYPTRENAQGSPTQDEGEQVGNYVDSTQNQDMPQADTKHPHQDSADRKPGDHPHKDMGRK